MVPRPKWKMVEDWDGPMWPVFSGLHSGPTFVLPPLRITLHHCRHRVYRPRLPSLFLWLLFSSSSLSPRRLLLLFPFFYFFIFFITNFITAFQVFIISDISWAYWHGCQHSFLGPNLKSGGPLYGHESAWY